MCGNYHELGEDNCYIDVDDIIVTPPEEPEPPIVWPDPWPEDPDPGVDPFPEPPGDDGGGSEPGGSDGGDPPPPTDYTPQTVNNVTYNDPQSYELIKPFIDAMMTNCVGSTLINSLDGYNNLRFEYSLEMADFALSGRNGRIRWNVDNPLVILEELIHQLQFKNNTYEAASKNSVNMEVEAKIAQVLYADKYGLQEELLGYETPWNNLRKLLENPDSPYDDYVSLMRSDFGYGDETRFPYFPQYNNTKTISTLFDNC